MIILALAVLFAGVAFAIVYFSGYRQITFTDNDGKVTKFIGKVDENGDPFVGNVYFPDGTKAKIDLANNKIEYSDGKVYVGETENLAPNGSGKLTFLSGEYYDGDFVNGEMTGYGVYVYAESIGDKYEGDMVVGKRDGTGKYTWADGSTYEGGYKADRKNGTGVYSWADGSSYSGEYVNDVKNGKGVYIYANGDTYDGEFTDDVRQGEGTYTWANGEKYIGEFKNNMMDGHGIYFWPTGRSYEGTFKDNVIVWDTEE